MSHARPPILAVLVLGALLAIGGYFAYLHIFQRGHGHALATAGSDETCLVAGINAARAAVGVGPVAVSDALGAFSRAHSDEMAPTGTIFDSGGSPSNQEPGSAVVRATMGSLAGPGVIGENVGWTSPGTCDRMTAGYVASPPHLAIMLDRRWSAMGVGVAYSADGSLFSTEVFTQGGTAAPPPTPRPTPSPVAVKRTPPPFVTIAPAKPTPPPATAVSVPPPPAPVLRAATPLTDTASVSASAQTPTPGAVSVSRRSRRRHDSLLVVALAAMALVVGGLLTYAVVAAKRRDQR